TETKSFSFNNFEQNSNELIL
nr:lectin 1, L-1 {N-terminal} [Psophocarpus tetragonolobus=winged beans, DC, leaves, Peptide Partial, 20 aa] [Psophocarpus tetragonolobus]